MSRNVVVVSPASNAPIKVADFSGSTWGEFRNHPQVYNHVSDNVEAVLRQGNVTLNREDAQLPEGDVTVFLVPTKNKAGMDSTAASSLGHEIAQAIEKAAALSSEQNVIDLKDRLIGEIADFFDVSESEITGSQEQDIASNEELSEEDRRLMEEYHSNYRH